MLIVSALCVGHCIGCVRCVALLCVVYNPCVMWLHLLLSVAYYIELCCFMHWFALCHVLMSGVSLFVVCSVLSWCVLVPSLLCLGACCFVVGIVAYVRFG